MKILIRRRLSVGERADTASAELQGERNGLATVEVQMLNITVRCYNIQYVLFLGEAASWPVPRSRDWESHQ